MPGGTGTPVTSHDYTTLAKLKARLGVADTADDTILSAVITAVSRWIDEHCYRRFYAATETRYYTAHASDHLLVDDLLSLTSLATDEDGDRIYETTWAPTDYDLQPDNAALDGEPYQRIATTPEGNYTFPVGIARGVKGTGSWGYSASTPEMIEEACLIQASRIAKRREAPFGLSGGPEFGQTAVIMRLDWDVRYMLEPFRRLMAV